MQKQMLSSLLLLALASHHSANADTFENFLAHQVFALPDTTIPNVALRIDAGTHNLTCSGLEIGATSGVVKMRDGIRVLSLTVDIGHFLCSGGWWYREEFPPHWPRDNGDVNLTIGSSRLGPFEITLFGERNQLPTNISMAHCESTMTVASFHFSSGVTGAIMNKLEPLVVSRVSSLLGTQLCEQLPSLVEHLNPFLLNLANRAGPLVKPVVPSPEPTLAPTTTTNVIDWRNSTVLAQIDKVVEVMGSNHSLLLNHVISTLTGGSGEMTFSPNISKAVFVDQLGAVVVASIREITVGGLDTWKMFDILEPSTAHSIESVVSIERLLISFGVDVSVGDGVYGKGGLSAFTLDLGLRDTTFGLTGFVAAIRGAQDNRTLGQLLQQPHCALDSFKQLNLTQLLITPYLSLLGIRETQGDFLSKIAPLITGLGSYLSNSFSNGLMSVLRGAVFYKLRPLINDVLLLLVESHPPCLPYQPPENQNDFFVFNTSTFVEVVHKVFSDELSPETVNNLIETATSILLGTPNQITIPGEIGLHSRMLNVSDISFRNINQFQDFNILSTEGAYTYSTGLTLGSNSGTPPLRWVNSSAVCQLQIDGFDKEVGSESDEIDLSFSFSEFHIFAQTSVHFNMTHLEMTPLTDLLSPCLLTAITNVRHETIEGHLNNLTIKMQQLEHSTEPNKLSRSLTALASGLAPLIPPRLVFPDGAKSFIDDQLENVLDSVRRSCGAVEPSGSSPASRTGLVAGTIGGGVVVAVVLLAFAVRSRTTKSESSTTAAFLMAGVDNADVGVDQGVSMKQSLRTIVATRWPHSPLRFVLEIGVPVLLIATTGLKIFALRSPVAEIRATATQTLNQTSTLPSETIHLVTLDLIDFTFQNMVEYFWKSEAYLISILVVGGTCALPFTRLFAMTLVWVLPLSHSKRMAIMGVSDSVSRLSFIDAFFLAQIVLLFKIDLEQPGGVMVSLRADPDIAVTVGVATGISCSFVSHVLSYLSAHFFQDQREKTVVQPEGEQEKTTATVKGKIVPSLIVVCLVVCFVLAYSNPLAAYTIEGIAGAVQGYPTTEFNAMTLPDRFPNGQSDMSGAIFVVIPMFFLTIVAPILSVVSFVLFVFCPSNNKWKKRLFCFCWYSFCWTGFDVLLWAFISGTLEMDMIAQWVIHNKYGAACEAVEAVAQEKCVYLGTGFRAGSWWLLGASLLVFGCVFYLVYAFAYRYREFVVRRVVVDTYTRVTGNKKRNRLLGATQPALLPEDHGFDD